MDVVIWHPKIDIQGLFDLTSSVYECRCYTIAIKQIVTTRKDVFHLPEGDLLSSSFALGVYAEFRFPCHCCLFEPGCCLL